MAIDIPNILLWIVTLANFSLGLLVLLKNPKGALNRYFCGFALSLAIWSIAIFFFRASSDYGLSFLSLRISYIAAVSIGFFFLQFAMLFPDKEHIDKKVKLILWVSTLLMVVSLLWPGLLVKEIGFQDLHKIGVINIPDFLIFFLYFNATFFGGLILTYKKLRLEKIAIQRTQLKYIFWSVLVAGLGGVIFNLYGPSPFINEWRFIWIGPIFTFFIALFITYAIVRYRLLNIRAIVVEILTSILTLAFAFELALAKSTEEVGLRLVVLVLVLIVGRFLIKSTVNEIKRREETEEFNKKLNSANARYKTANAKLKEMDRLKTEFITVASHKLRTPLNSTKWALEFLLKGDDGAINEKQRETVTEVLSVNKRLITLSNDLLNISRIDEGRIKIDPKPVDVAGLIKEILAECMPMIKKKNVSLQEHYDTLPLINLDAAIIRKALFNIISNGITYNLDGKRLWIDVRRNKEMATIMVKDEGIGIPLKEQEHLFQRFFRASNASTTDTEGGGFGLFTAKTAIEMSGGSISFESKENEGAVFTITLPLAGSKARKGELGLV